jgi:hypothetical protein
MRVHVPGDTVLPDTREHDEHVLYVAKAVLPDADRYILHGHEQ